VDKVVIIEGKEYIATPKEIVLIAPITLANKILLTLTLYTELPRTNTTILTTAKHLIENII
jgi:hypothetical protein